MPLIKNSATINEGQEDQFNLIETIIPDLSYRYEFRNFVNDQMSKDDNHYVSNFVDRTIWDIMETFEGQGNTYKIKVEVGGEYPKVDDENETKFFVRSTNYVRFKSIADYYDQDNNLELSYKLTNPSLYFDLKGIDGDLGTSSAYSWIKTISHLTINLIKIFDYNTNNLTTRHTLIESKLNNYIYFIPVNDDKLCILHCIYAYINKIKGSKQFYNVDNYLDDFNQWVDTHNLLSFYDDDRNFDLKNINKLEDHLKVSINLYSKEDKHFELEYRSKYIHDEHIIPILLVPYSDFKNYKHKLVYDKVKDKNYIPFVSKTLIASNSHAVLFRPTMHGVAKKSKKIDFCRYCDKDLNPSSVQIHEENCRNFYKNASNLEERLYQFKPPKETLEFDKFGALLQLPFVSYDFETRYDENLKQSVLLSYSLCFVNVFELKKSIYLHNVSYDLNEINSLLVYDILFLAKYYYSLQNKDKHNNKEKCTINECPVCLKKSTKYEFNHSHFNYDRVNKKYDTFMCPDCNKKLQVKNKPLQFYAFNAKNYDNTFLLHALTSSTHFKANNFEFLAKSASKFTSIKLNIQIKHCSSIEFKDAILHFPGNSLDGATKAILKKEEHFELLKIILKKEYKTHEIYPLSKVKAPFPYEKLNKDNFDHIGKFVKEDYHNTLSKKDLTVKEYCAVQEIFLSLKKILKREITFKDYHDFYLLLDTTLLACLLLTYMKQSYKETKINPLAFISSSSHAFSSFLYINHYQRNKNIIKLPPSEVQLELKEGVHGGFTHVFNKKNDRNENSITTYVDATSLYPTQFQNYLPYEYVGVEDVSKFNEIMEEDLDEGEFWYFIIADIKALDEKYQHKLRNYPLFPSKIKIEKEWLSEDQIERFDFNGRDLSKNNDSKIKYKPQVKNTVTFFEKKEYHCSARYLKNAINLGYEVEKVHKIHKFKQAPVMKDFVDYFYQMKRNASLEIKRLTKLKNSEIKSMGDKITREEKEKIELKYHEQIANLNIIKTLAKLILNACYGSCLVDSLRFTEVEMVSNQNIQRIQKLASSFRFKDMLLTDNNTLIHKSPYKFSLNYPIMLGVAILDDSKIQMSNYIMKFYDFITSKGLELVSCYCDTDSYVSSVVQKDKVIFKNKMEMFKEFNKFHNAIDMSWYTGDNYSNENEEQLGMFTDELESEKAIINANFLCAKVYSMVGEDNVNKLKAKGISKDHVEKLCNYELYETIIDGNYDKKEKLTFEMKKIQNQYLKVDYIDLKKQYITYVDIKNYYDKNSSDYLIFGEKKHLDIMNKAKSKL